MVQLLFKFMQISVGLELDTTNKKSIFIMNFFFFSLLCPQM